MSLINERIMLVDDIDRRLLRHLQADPDLPTAALAQAAGLTTATCWRRLEKLSSGGIIRRKTAIINWRALGFEVEVSLRITLDKTARTAFDEFIAAAREVPEVHEIQTFLGVVDVRLNVLARDVAHYQDIYRTRILALPHISDIEALMLVSNVAHAPGLPL